jgi:hypothetical protein
VNPTQVSVALGNSKPNFLRESERRLWTAILNTSLGSPATDELNNFSQTFDALETENNGTEHHLDWFIRSKSSTHKNCRDPLTPLCSSVLRPYIISENEDGSAVQFTSITEATTQPGGEITISTLNVSQPWAATHRRHPPMLISHQTMQASIRGQSTTSRPQTCARHELGNPRKDCPVPGQAMPPNRKHRCCSKGRKPLWMTPNPPISSFHMSLNPKRKKAPVDGPESSNIELSHEPEPTQNGREPLWTTPNPPTSSFYMSLNPNRR